ncbi:hypothetical protein QQS21_000620 [Conoideocrella luteorostrata]|uniref:COP9 signalosome complex subunit 6 n=1 Tax=Conoideocrella luteorostrata TaxID=1105319 RepID=A0AAJ0D1H7_9HYPO|nr:hypothetical protein QQS21_000620 [Conoideocrella luteorostrata]
MDDAKSHNTLVSSQKSAQLRADLHALVPISITDHITRHTLREQQWPVIGGLLGQQNGREITIEHTFECHIKEDPRVEGGYLLDETRFDVRLNHMVTVHKDRQLELVGWYTLLPLAGPTSTILPIHTQILENWNESAVLLAFHPEELLERKVGEKIPFTIYESNYEVDGQKKNEHDGEDKRMDDGEAPLKLKFREVSYSVVMDETEMIAMNYVAAGTGAAASASVTTKDDRPARSIEPTGKGKRRLVEADEDELKEPDFDEAGIDLTREEDEMVASLTAKANAIKMLHSRIRVATTYLERLPPSYINNEAAPDTETMDTDHTTPSLPILRQIQALVNRLDLVIPSDKEAFDKEIVQETNNITLTNLLNSIMQSVNGARDVSKKASIIETQKAAIKRSGLEHGYLASPGFNIPGAGDILM